jgi:hypothetical protein
VRCSVEIFDVDEVVRSPAVEECVVDVLNSVEYVGAEVKSVVDVEDCDDDI